MVARFAKLGTEDLFAGCGMLSYIHVRRMVNLLLLAFTLEYLCREEILSFRYNGPFLLWDGPSEKRNYETRVFSSRALKSSSFSS